jgi:NitT/TauT family transport system substrate-binding protein
MIKHLCSGVLLAALAVGAAQAATPLAVGYVAAASFIPAAVARDQGFFATHGIDITLTQVANATTVAGAVQSGSLQVATMTMPPFLQATEGGLDLKLLAGANLQQSSNPTCGLVVTPESGIKTPADFAGKSIADPGANGTAEVLTRKYLQDHGVDLSKVRFVEVPFPQTVDALRAKQVDAAVTVEPILSRVLAQHVATLFTHVCSDVNPSYLEAMYVVNGAWATQHPDAVTGFRAALTDALAYMNSHPDEARRQLTAFLKMPPDIARNVPLPDFTVAITPAQVAFWIGLLHQDGILHTELSPTQVMQP